MPNQNSLNSPTHLTHPLSLTDLSDLLTNLPPGGTIEFKKTARGDIVMLNNHQTKDQLIQEKYAHLKGVGISLTDAAKKYEVPRPAISNWVYKSNYVCIIDEDSYPQLIDEAEVALCAEIYKERKAAGTSGLPYFDDQGQVITEVKRPATSRPNYRRRKKR